MDFEKLQIEFKDKEYKNIEIADLRGVHYQEIGRHAEGQ